MRYLLGFLLQTIGLLIAGASGFCSTSIVWGFIWDQFTNHTPMISKAQQIWNLFGTVALLGGGFVLLGIFLIWCGKAFVKDANQDRHRR